jgi:hypothetical protein
MHAKLAKFALLTHGARQMATYAQQGAEQKGYVDLLLNDDKLIVEVMELGGAAQQKYGQAMQIYQAIQKASENAATKDFYRLWALASSLEHPDGAKRPEGQTAAESIVDFYLNYEKAFHDGELDPAFGTLPAWECRWIFDFQRGLVSAVWLRQMMQNYRPDHMKLDYKWRYCRITKSDVPYTSNAGGARAIGAKKHNLSAIPSFFLEGGICGPRAFVGRSATHAFGIPSMPSPSQAHAAIAHWTPDGWVTVFGPHWTFSRAQGNGLKFELQSRARKNPERYRHVLRAHWLGEALGESDLTHFGCAGGTWKALAFYKQLAIVEDDQLKEGETVGAELAESNVPAVSDKTGWTPDTSTTPKVPEFPQVKLTDADRTITTDANGVITIPVAACSKPNSTEKIRFMKSYDDSFVQMHYNLAGNTPELLAYTMELPKAGKYAFSANVVSVTIDRRALIRVNRRQLYDIDIPLSMGSWVETEPVEMELKAGRNRFLFTCKAPNKGLSVKSFTLRPLKEK